MKLILIMLSFVTISCSTSPTYTVKIDSIRGNFNHKTYVIIPIDDKNMKTPTLEYLKFEEELNKALSLEFLKSDIENADMIVMFGYAISGPQQNIETQVIPHYMPGQTFNHFGRVYNNSSSLNYNGTSVSQGQWSYNSQIYSYNTFIRNILIIGLDKKSAINNEYVELFKTQIQSEGSSQDLRTLIPIMIKGASNDISKDLKSTKTIELNENGDLIKNLFK